MRSGHPCRSILRQTELPFEEFMKLDLHLFLSLHDSGSCISLCIPHVIYDMVILTHGDHLLEGKIVVDKQSWILRQKPQEHTQLVPCWEASSTREVNAFEKIAQNSIMQKAHIGAVDTLLVKDLKRVLGLPKRWFIGAHRYFLPMWRYREIAADRLGHMTSPQRYIRAKH